MAVRKIIEGPSSWDIMLGFFSKKEVVFTLGDGVVVRMGGIDGMWDMGDYNSIDPDIDESIDEGYLLCGPDETGNNEIFVEYRTQARQGCCLLVPVGERTDSAFLPAVWSNIMGLHNLYTPRPS